MQGIEKANVVDNRPYRTLDRAIVNRQFTAVGVTHQGRSTLLPMALAIPTAFSHRHSVAGRAGQGLLRRANAAYPMSAKVEHASGTP